MHIIESMLRSRETGKRCNGMSMYLSTLTLETLPHPLSDISIISRPNKTSGQ